MRCDDAGEHKDDKREPIVDVGEHDGADSLNSTSSLVRSMVSVLVRSMTLVVSATIHI